MSEDGPCCIDLANHLNSIEIKAYEDRYAQLLDWSAAVGGLLPEELATLRREAASRPAEAASVAARGLDLARALRRVLVAAAEDDPPASEDLALLNRELAASLGALALERTADGYRLSWSAADLTLETVLWPVVRSAADLLVSCNMERLKVCAAEDCRWLFVDTSRNGSRRWCDMKVCGNREKVRRHRAASRSERN